MSRRVALLAAGLLAALGTPEPQHRMTGPYDGASPHDGAFPCRCPACEPAQPYRVGQPGRRTLYRQAGPDPSDSDRFLGLLDSPDIAATVVHALNRTGIANDEVTRDASRRVADIVAETQRQVRAVEQRCDRLTRELDATRTARDDLATQLRDRDHAAQGGTP